MSSVIENVRIERRPNAWRRPFHCALGVTFRETLRRPLLLALMITALALSGRAIGSFSYHFIFGCNFHVVSDGRFYRSGQMPAGRLAEVIKKYNIHTVVDIRAGEPLASKFGYSEPDLVRSLGAQYVHIPLIGSRIPSRESISTLLRTYDAAEEPLLIHDSSGTHRAGVASAIWLLSRAEVSPEIAQGQLTFSYGFIRYERALKTWIQGFPTIDNLIWNYTEEYNRSGAPFRSWYLSALAEDDSTWSRARHPN